MPEYNFLNLSPWEFEDLSRDLLQKHLGITLESFTSGRDKGIDLRYSNSETNKKLIVQCKRYNDYKTLYRILIKEQKKVLKLTPDRYIITTSVGLTPLQKDEILKIFVPFLKSSSDIFGKEDLNNLLGQNPDIEKKHFKLWLSSTNILERILHGKIYNQSIFEEEKIKETIKIYVENESYHKALKIIKDKKYVILSGIPGIGKTTLARILVYYHLTKDFEEFISLSDSINDAYRSYNETIKQVFLFDDFLGRNFLNKKLNTNEEQLIVKFIEKINKSNNKILILTTREYILTQAKHQYDVFENPKLDFAKCVVDLSDYTKLIRAKIFYNHLYFSNISESHIKNILDKKTYISVIRHQNYNPRIIEIITGDNIWKNILPNQFSQKVMEFLNYPEKIWKHVYENQISTFSQCVLANLMTAGTPIFWEELKTLIQNFAEHFSSKYGITYSELEFNKAIQELENTFIKIIKDGTDQFVIEYQNPSVLDFLVNYFKQFPDYVEDILNSVIYYNQLFNVFTMENYETNSPSQKTYKIVLNEKNKKLLISKLINEFDSLQSSQISTRRIGVSTIYVKNTYSDLIKLNEIIKEFPLDKYPKIKAFVVEKFREIIKPMDLNRKDYFCHVNLLQKLNNEYDLDKVEIIKNSFKNVSFLEQIEIFEKFGEIFPEEYQSFIKSTTFRAQILGLMEEEADNVADILIEGTLDEIQAIGSKFGIAYSSIEEELIDRMVDRDEEEGINYNYLEDYKPEENDSDEIIENMFEGLRTEQDT